jgi:hypothetical protein
MRFVDLLPVMVGILVTTVFLAVLGHGVSWRPPRGAKLLRIGAILLAITVGIFVTAALLVGPPLLTFEDCYIEEGTVSSAHRQLPGGIREFGSWVVTRRPVDWGALPYLSYTTETEVVQFGASVEILRHEVGPWRFRPVAAVWTMMMVALTWACAGLFIYGWVPKIAAERQSGG